MSWALLDVLLAVATLLLLIAVGWALFRRVRLLLRAGKAASARLGEASAALGELPRR